MSKLAKWLPFMFKRKHQNEDGRDATAVPVRVQPRTPAQPALDTMLSDRFWQDPFSLFGAMDRFFGDFTPQLFQPSIDVVDEGKHVRVTAELPGVDRKDLDVSVEEGLLVLRGEKKSEEEVKEEGCYRLERYFGQFTRAVPLPHEVDIDRPEAKFEKGLLTIRFPKTGEATKTRRISIG